MKIWGTIKLISVLFLGFIVGHYLFAPKLPLLGQQYNMGYFDCMNDLAAKDPAVINKLHEEEVTQVSEHNSIVSIGETPLKWYYIYNHKEDYEIYEMLAL